MNNETTKRIKIIDIVGANTISSRDVVINFLPIIKKNLKNSIVFDFSDINFISRSAAHELIKLKTKYFNITFSNLADEVSEMLRIIAANIASPKKSQDEFSPEKTTFSALLN